MLVRGACVKAAKAPALPHWTSLSVLSHWIGLSAPYHPVMPTPLVTCEFIQLVNTNQPPTDLPGPGLHRPWGCSLQLEVWLGMQRHTQQQQKPLVSY